MSISRVQGNEVNSGGSVTSQAVTLSSGITQGNLAVASVACGSNVTTITGPSGWTQAVINQPAGSNATIETSIWSMVVPAGHAGETSWTWNFSASHSVYICIEEWNSTTGWMASPVDQTVQGDTSGSPTTSTTPSSGTTSTTLEATELWIASIAYKGSAQSESSITSGWTKDLEATLASNNTMTMLYQVASSTGTAGCQYTIGTAQYWAGCVATFKPAQQRTIPATVALQSTNSRTILAAAALQSTNSRTVPATAALTNTFSRTIPATAALTNSGTRTIPATAALLATLSRTIPVTAALTVTNSRTIPASTALARSAVFYASNISQTLGGLTQSDQMSQTSGGTETSFTVTMPASGTNTYVELLSQGGISSGTPALPAPTGKGWSINLSGNTILAGGWTFAFTLAKSGTSMSGASLTVRAYRRTMDGTYYPIAATTLSSQTFSTSKTVYTTSMVSVSWPWQFVSGDTLYMDAFPFNAGTAWNSDVFTVYVSNSATQGVYNDGIIIAPTMITTPAGLSCMIGATSFQTGATLPIRDQSFTLADAVDQRSILTLTGEDVTGTQDRTPNQPVILSDYTQGKLYDGYLASDKVSRPAAGGSSTQLEHQMTCVDHHRDYDKESNTTNYLNWTGGDIVCDFVLQQQHKNNIWGEFAMESDYTTATFGAGTLTNTVATTTTSPFTYAPNTASPPVTSNTGDLELVRAGTQFTLTESTTSDFSSGTLTNMAASNNELAPNTQSAIKVTALYSPVAAGSNVAATESGGAQTSGEYVLNLAKVRIWTGSLTVGSNDTLNYDLWISSTSPAFIAGVDIQFSDGSHLSDHNGTLDSASDLGLFDQNGASVDLLQDLSAYAKDCWYTRQIALTGLSGKTIIASSVYLAGSSSGTYTVFAKNIYLGSQPGSPIFSTIATATQNNPPPVFAYGAYLSSVINTSVVSAYNPLVSYRVSSAHSISGVGLVQNSTITWTASLPTSSTTMTYPPGTTGPTASSSGTSPAMVMMVSYDGNCWLQCTNSQALPGLPPGANVSGLSLYLREQFACGSDPTAIPALLDVSITINSAANQTVSDVVTAYGTSSQWNTGTTQVLTGPNSNGNLTLGSNPFTRDWNDNLITNQTFLAGPNNASTQAATGGAYTMTPAVNSGGTWCQSRLDFAGYFQNGTIECDVKMSSLSTSPQCGIEYRQTGWGNANNNFAYYVFLRSDGAIEFGYGSNDFGNTSGTYTSIIAVSTGSISAGTFYHLKIVVKNNRHTIYFNHSSTALIDILDNNYVAAGQIGFRAYTASGSATFTATIDNFSMVATASGTWTSPATSLTSLGTCGYSQVSWTDLDSRGQVEATTTVLASVDSGSTWMQCTNGAEIPQLARGTSTSGKSLVLQMILSSTTPPISTPVIMGLYVRVCGNFGTVTGTRISPVLPLTPVGYVASSNVMWNANTPTSTSLAVQTTQDLSSFHTVGSNGAGEALPYWSNQPSATQDLFNSNTSSNYTNTSKFGGSAATPAYDTANSRITLAGGSGGLYLNNAISCADVDLFVDIDESDSGGMAWRKVDASNFYSVSVADASSSIGTPNTLTLYRTGYSGGIGSDAPLAYYRLGEASGTSAADSSGHGYTGTYANSGVTYGQAGAISGGDTNTAVLFNGSTGKMTMPVAVSQIETGSFSFEAWIKVASYPGGSTSLLANYNSPSSNVGAGFGMNSSGQINWTVCDAGGSFIAITSSPVSTGIFHHIIGTYDGANSKFYLDGVLVGSAATTFGANTTDAIQVGSSPYGDYATCTMDEVAIYGTALSLSRVQAHCNAATTPPSTQLGSVAIAFTRGTFHRIRGSMQGGLINVYWDGTCKMSYLDTSPLAGGACGLYNNGGTSRYYQLWVQPLGTNLSGQALYTKTTMTTSDPSVMPQLFTLVCCIRGPSIGTGATISALHPVNKPFAAYYSSEVDSIVQASGDYYSYVDKWRQFRFGARLARPGAFPVQSVAVDAPNNYSGYLLYRPQVTALSSADLFRNNQIVTNVSSLISPPTEVKVADGSTTSWQMGYPLYSAPTILINGNSATIGLQGVDSGKQFYWQVNSASISYDSSLPKLPAGTVITFTYTGQSPVNVVLNNTSSQTTQAALELNSGIVAEIESALNSTTQGMTTSQATTFGNGLLTRYGNNAPIELMGTTLYPGLVPGTVIAAFVPELNAWNAQLPVVSLTTTVVQGANGQIWLYSVDATNGPNLNNWSRLWY